MSIHPTSQSRQNWHSINWGIIFIFVSLLQMFISSLAFLIFEADTVMDAGKSFYCADTTLWCANFYLIQMWKMPEILKLIENFEKFIEESKSPTIYS